VVRISILFEQDPDLATAPHRDFHRVCTSRNNQVALSRQAKCDLRLVDSKLDLPTVYSDWYQTFLLLSVWKPQS